MLRVDTPAKIRKRAERADEGLYKVVLLVALLGVFSGVGGAGLLLLGGYRATDFIGAGLCFAWAFAWVQVMRRTFRVNASTIPWRINRDAIIGELDLWRAHGVYERLSPETQANYGLALIQRMYVLSQLDVRGGAARGKISSQMANRVKVLNRLLDAEDKQRLYAVDPLLADRDDINAAELWRKAVAEADRYLRNPEL